MARRTSWPRAWRDFGNAPTTSAKRPTLANGTISAARINILRGCLYCITISPVLILSTYYSTVIKHPSRIRDAFCILSHLVPVTYQEGALGGSSGCSSEYHQYSI